jgi:hypothetical protein
MVNFLGPGAFDCARPAAVRPLFDPENGPGDQDDFFQDCTSPLARDGTEWKAGLLNFMIANWRSLVRKSGIPASNLDDDIVTRAVRKGHRYLAAVGGTANAITATLDPAIASYGEIEGAQLDLLIATPNTSAAVTLNLNGQGAVPVLRLDGSQLSPGDLRGPVGLTYIGGTFYLRTLPVNAAGLNGQVELVLSGGNLALLRKNGHQMIVNGVPVTIPTTGILLAPTGAAANTTYFIYLYLDAGVPTLERSTTVRTTHTDGTQIKTGDPTRALVGIARTNASSLWEDSASKRFVRSYFNRKPLPLWNRFTANRSTGALEVSKVEINAEIRCEFVCFSDDTILAVTAGYFFNDGANFTYCAVAFDGTTTATGTISAAYGTAGSVLNAARSAGPGLNPLSDGYHYATLVGYVSGGTGTWGGGAANTPTCAIHALLL